MDSARTLLAAVALIACGQFGRTQAPMAPPARYRPDDSVATADKDFAVVADRMVADGMRSASRSLTDWLRAGPRVAPTSPSDVALVVAVRDLGMLCGSEEVVALANKHLANAKKAPAVSKGVELRGGMLPPVGLAAAGNDKAKLALQKAQHAAAARLTANRTIVQNWLAAFADLHARYLYSVAPKSRFAASLAAERRELLAEWRRRHERADRRLSVDGAIIVRDLNLALNEVLVHRETEDAPWIGRNLARWQHQVRQFLVWDDDASDIDSALAGEALLVAARHVVEGFLEADAEVFRRALGSPRHLGAMSGSVEAALELAFVEAARGRSNRALERLTSAYRALEDDTKRDTLGLVDYFRAVDFAAIHTALGTPAKARPYWDEARKRKDPILAQIAALPNFTLTTMALRNLVDRRYEVVAHADSIAAAGDRDDAMAMAEYELVHHMRGHARLHWLLRLRDSAPADLLGELLARVLSAGGTDDAARQFEHITALRARDELRARLYEETAASGDHDLAQRLLFFCMGARGIDLGHAQALEEWYRGAIGDDDRRLTYADSSDVGVLAKLEVMEATRGFLQTPKVADVAASLREREALVVTAGYRHQSPWRTESLPTADRFVAMSLLPNGALQRFELGSARAIQIGCEALRESLAPGRELRGRDPNRSSTRTDGGSPHAELLKALAPLLASLPRDLETLWISADGALASIPWETLLIAAGWTDLPVSRYVSGPVAIQPRRPCTAPPRLLAMGNVAYDRPPNQPTPPSLARVLRLPEGMRWPPLPGATRERDKVAEIFRATHPTGEAWVLDGQDASTHYLFGLAHKVRFLHLATHAFVLPQPLWGETGGPIGVEDRNLEAMRATRAGLVLAGANLWRAEAATDLSIVTAAELATIDLTGCELVVLSACETNVGSRNFGEAMAGLNKALFAAGARHTITSLWQVDDEGTADFFGEFYERLWRAGRDIPSAFRDTQRALRQRGVAASRWAAFVLSSNGR